jgi:calcium-dependent protein kinase
VVTNRGRIQDCYKFEGRSLGLLGSGGFGSVRKAERIVDGSLRAIKTINLERASRTSEHFNRMQREIAIMKMLDHPGLIKIYEIWEDKKDIHLVMEVCSGGELFAKICDVGQLSEPDAAGVTKQALAAVLYLHERGVCHRDLKPENFLLESTARRLDKCVLKLIDFGLSRTFNAGDRFATKIGTPYYVAPQVLTGSYNELCDVWSAGVLVYLMLSGTLPFDGDTDKEVLRCVKSGRYSYDESWACVSRGAKDLINRMLTYNPELRFSARQAFEHAWVVHRAPGAKSVPLDTGRVDNLRRFCSMSHFKRASLELIASLLSEDKIKTLREMFRGLDTNGDGMLSVGELREGVVRAGLGEIVADLEQIARDCDTNGSGEIDFTEFLAAAMDRWQYLQEEICWSAFCVFDRNGDGKITCKELSQVLHDDGVEKVLAHRTAKELIKEVDEDGNGEVDFDEFMEMLRRQ